MNERSPSGHGHLYFAYAFHGDEFWCENSYGDFWNKCEPNLLECIAYDYFMGQEWFHKDGSPMTEEEVASKYDDYFEELVNNMRKAKNRRKETYG